MNITPVNLNAVAPVTSTTDLPPEQKAERARLVQAVKAINQANIFGDNNELTFVWDRNAHRVLMRVVDRETHDVVMQVPPDYVLQLSEQLQPKSSE